MDELLTDLKGQADKEPTEQKTLFTSITDIEKEMAAYEKWIGQTKDDMLAIDNKDLTLKVKTDNDQIDSNKTKLE